MIPIITTTFLKLSDATSKNLEFSQRNNVSINYGEEIITESNLLEIRRRHPEVVNLYTFSKAKEALTGADILVFEPNHGNDTVISFNSEEDRIDLTAFDAGPNYQPDLSLSQNGTLLTLNNIGGSDIIFNGVTLTETEHVFFV